VIENNSEKEQKNKKEGRNRMSVCSKNKGLAVGPEWSPTKKRTKLHGKIRKFKPFQGPPPLMKLKKKVGNEFSLLV
jgi:hypothetical protein